MNLKDKIKDIARYEYMYFMKDPNVVGVACGNKYINNIDTGRLCIKIYVKKKYPKGYNPRGDIPPYYYGIPTDVIESGEFFASGFDARIRPAKMGYGIQPYDSTKVTQQGTAGCIVTRAGAAGNSEFFILSNNHIMADLNRLPIGTPILQPSLGVFPTDRIATLTDFVLLNLKTPQSELENYADAAIAKIDDINLVRPKIAFMTIPKGVDTNPQLNSIVKKSGLATGYTTGKIESNSGVYEVEYRDNKEALFVNQIITTKMSEAGDSGAVVLNENNEVIGIILATSTTNTIINKIDNIQNTLNVFVYTQK